MAEQDGTTVGRAMQAYVRLAPLTVPLYAILLAMAIGSLVMLSVGADPVAAYAALFEGALGGPERIAQSLGRSIPFIAASLAVAFAFKAGLLNIGAEGQLFMGATAGAWVGTWSVVAGSPPVLAVPAVLLAGLAAGFVWGGIPGVLKARTGAHEVITTIMLNAVAARIVTYLITSREPVLLLDTSASSAHTVPVADAARLPRLVAGTDLHLGIVLAVLLCVGTWFVLERTTPGFQIRTVGLNSNAARYAGMSVQATIVLVLAVSGALAGVAGAAEVAGSRAGWFTPGSFTGIGFDSIAIALLARANPFAVVPAAFLWGALLAGAPLMQLRADLSIDIVRIVQALIILFVAADVMVRTLFRIRSGDGPVESEVLTQGWGA